MLYTFFAACKQYGIDPKKWLNGGVRRRLTDAALRLGWERLGETPDEAL